MNDYSEFQELSDEQLTVVAGGQQVNGNATGQLAVADASGNAGNGLLNAANLALGGAAAAAPANFTAQANVAILSIVL